MFKQIEEVREGKDIEEYKDAFRSLYFEEGLFKNNKSKELLEKTLQELNSSLRYTQQSLSIMKNVAKVFLIELFEETIEIREKMRNKV